MIDVDSLRSQVLGLPAAERVGLMEDILGSLDARPREMVEKVWAEEIEKRRNAYREGRIGIVTKEESRKRLGL